MTTTNRRAIALAGVAAAALLAGPAFAQSEIAIGTMIFPESIASAPDGALLIGSFTASTVFKVAPGATQAEPWLTTGIGPIITGVFVEGDTVYVCSNGAFGSGESTLKTFDYASAAETGSYALPAGSFCSDTAVGADGSVYVTSLNFSGGPGAIFALNDDGTFTTLVSDVAYAGLDGIAFVDGTLYANDLMTGALYRVNLGETTTLTALTLSEPLAGPDGMRTTEDGTGLLIAEQYANRISMVTIDGDNATVTEVAGGLVGPAGVAQIGDTAYVVEAHFDAMQSGEDPGPFVVKAIPLP